MVHVSKCPLKEGRGHPSHEFTFEGKKYIYCLGWQNMMTDEPNEICKNCPDHVSHAPDDLDKLLRNKPMTVKEGFKKGNIPDTGSELQEILYKIAVEKAETIDDFIFTTFQDYMGQKFPTAMSCIPKRLLVRALECFQKEHAEEYAELMKESYTRCVKGGGVDGTD